MKKHDDEAVQSAAAKFITAADPAEQTEKPKKKRGRPARKAEPAAAADPKTDEPRKKRKSAFSVWLDNQTAADLRLYATVSGLKVTDIVQDAIDDYLKQHKLTAKQKREYKQRELERINSI